jgi:hypothetical protein
MGKFKVTGSLIEETPFEVEVEAYDFAEAEGLAVDKVFDEWAGGGVLNEGDLAPSIEVQEVRALFKVADDQAQLLKVVDAEPG